MAVESELPLRRPSVESGVDTNGDSKVVAPQPVTDELRQKIIGEAKDIEFDCRVAARCHSRAATFWLIIHYALGLPAAVLAAVAGISAIADHPTWAAILAISSAVVAGMNTFLNPGQMTQGHSKKRSEYEHLKNDVRHFRNITLLMQGDAATLAQDLMRLSEARDALNIEAPQVRRAVWEEEKKEQKKREAGEFDGKYEKQREEREENLQEQARREG